MRTLLAFYNRKAPSLEWSGAIIYKLNGSVIEPIEVYPIIDGSGSFTEYRILEHAPEMMTYLFNKGWMATDGYYYGHFHSHHNMSCYFSDTDDKELAESTYVYGMYLSMIVNNEMKFVARMSRQVTINALAHDFDQNHPIELDFEVVQVHNIPIEWEKEDVSVLSPEVQKSMENSIGKFQSTRAKKVKDVPNFGWATLPEPSKQNGQKVQDPPTLFDDKEFWNAPAPKYLKEDSVLEEEIVIGYIIDCLVSAIEGLDYPQFTPANRGRSFHYFFTMMTEEQVGDFVDAIFSEFDERIEVSKEHRIIAFDAMVDDILYFLDNFKSKDRRVINFLTSQIRKACESDSKTRSGFKL